MSERTSPGSRWASEPPLPDGVVMLECDPANAPTNETRETLTIGETVWVGLRAKNGASVRFCVEIECIARVDSERSSTEYSGTVVSEIKDPRFGVHLGSRVWFKARHVLDID